MKARVGVCCCPNVGVSKVSAVIIVSLIGNNKHATLKTALKRVYVENKWWINGVFNEYEMSDWT